ncbi:monooxygenase [Actinorhabdospora filicis]|uniref:Monooxygenase n=1 Tax=Actinorhabdospora filicis TaxID=1785913 RepID=A0A9W6WAM6_9ACTN|nr:NAD(P)/FAD-dependent oxidoreductase [Actinorhabdospora filicis]GLZ78756.1 monooxygenase [Actinorhabdospora filicis]
MKITVIGAGIGGLCLAQGLRGSGAQVTVCERDTAPTAREQGYRLHIDPTGSAALRRCLTPEAWHDLTAATGDPGTAGFGFHTQRLRTLCQIDDTLFRAGITGGHHAADRATLRRTLLHGLDATVDFGRHFTHYEALPGGGVRAHFTHGPPLDADLLVGADGTRSRVRAQLLPHAGRVDTGATGTGGRLALTPETRSWLPEVFSGGLNVVMGPRDFLFTAVHVRRDPTLPGEDYLLWALVTRSGVIPGGLSGEAARDPVAARVRQWHPLLRRMVAETDPATVNSFAFFAARPVGAWRSGPVTVLGDALHAMPPTGGVGANTALRDAAALSGALRRAMAGGRLRDELAAFEAGMRDYGFAAVAASLARTRQAIQGRVPRAFARVFLGACGKIGPLRRAVFSGQWS